MLQRSYKKKVRMSIIFIPIIILLVFILAAVTINAIHERIASQNTLGTYISPSHR